MKSAYRKAAQAKRQQREQGDMDGSVLCRHGATLDIPTGLIRAWYQLKGDVKRWADNDEPVEEVQT